MTTKIYTIKDGDTLSYLAKRYHTDAATLKKLNSEQIKNIDLIFSGDKLNLPELPVVDAKDRIDPPTLPKPDPQGGRDCQQPEFVDLVYFPYHPKTKSDLWLLLNEDAQKAYIKEEGYFDAAMTMIASGDDEGKTQFSTELQRLGVLDSFMSWPHDPFLVSQDGDATLQKNFTHISADGDDRAHYHQILLELQALDASTSDGHLKIDKLTPEQLQRIVDGTEKPDEKIQLPQDERAGLQQAAARQLDSRRIQATSFESGLGVSIAKHMMANSVSDYIDNVRERLEDRVKQFENIAKSNAKTLTTSHDLHFAWYDNGGHGGYYSNERDLAISKQLPKYKAIEQDLQSDYADDPQTFKTKLAQSQPYLNPAQWVQYVEKLKHTIMGQEPEAYGTTLIQTRQCLTFCELIEQGIALREVVLSADELCQLPAQLNPLLQKDKLKDSDLEILYQALPETTDYTSPSAAPQWGYYAVKLLSDKANALVKKKIEDFSDLVGTIPPDDYLKKPIETKKALQNMREQWETFTRNRLQQEKHFYDPNWPVETHITLVWDHSEWHPKKESTFLNQTLVDGASLYSPLECYRLGNQGKAGFVRYQCDLTELPESSDLEYGQPLGRLDAFKLNAPNLPADRRAVHTLRSMFKTELDALKKSIVDKLAADTTQSNIQSSKGSVGSRLANRISAKLLEKAIAQANTLYPKGGKTLFKFDEAIYDSKQQMLHTDPMNRYDVSMQAQFFRLSANINALPWGGSKLDTQNKKVKVAAFELGGEIDLANASIGGAFNLPNALGSPWLIRYQVQTTVDKRSVLTTQEYELGRFRLAGNYSAYGMVGASIKMAGSLEFGYGPNGGVGLRGRRDIATGATSIKALEPTVTPVKSGGRMVVSRNKVHRSMGRVSMGAGASADLFAGLEIGQTLMADALWQPPAIPGEKVQWLSLGNSGFNSHFNAGLSAHSQFWLGIDRGRLVITFGGALAVGVGAGGKFTVKADLNNIEQLLSFVQRMVARPGYRRVVFMGSVQNEHKKLADNSEQINDDDSFAWMTSLFSAGFSGMSLAQLAILSVKELKSLGTSTLKKENAYNIALFINANAAGRDWVKNLIPEVRSRAITALTYNTPDSKKKKSDDGFSIQGDLGGDADTNPNAVQAQAILSLLLQVSTEGDVAKQRQYQETLQRCGQPNGQFPQGVRDDQFYQHMTYWYSWQKIAQYVKNHDSKGIYLGQLIDLHSKMGKEINSQFKRVNFTIKGTGSYQQKSAYGPVEKTPDLSGSCVVYVGDDLTIQSTVQQRVAALLNHTYTDDKLDIGSQTEVDWSTVDLNNKWTKAYLDMLWSA